jgi:1,4-alpha-glucan branching enzyme
MQRALLSLVTLLTACGGGAKHPASVADMTNATPSDAGSADSGIALAPNLGANVSTGGVTFRLWAPHATAATVVGSFAASPATMMPLAAGLFEANVTGAKAGDSYHFTLADGTGTLDRTDPYCRQLSGSDCVVVDPAAYAWHTPTFTRAPRNSTIVYELHVGSFAVPSGATMGSFASTAAALAPVADLGANVVEVMPIQSYGSAADTWGYNPQLFFAPRPELGSSDDLRGLVDTAHGLGVGVWMDTVVNHTDGWNQAPLYCYDAPCTDGGDGIYFFPPGTYATTPWGPRPNYAEPEVASMLLTAVGAWIDELHGDGFRWDSVSNIRALDGSGAVPGGKDLLVAANELIHAKGGMSVAEDLKGYGAITQAPSAGGFGFDAQWDGFGGEVTGVLTQASDANRDLGAIQSALTSNSGGDPFARLLYIEDHDTVGNGGARLPSLIDAADPESWASRRLSILGGVLLMTSPGVPMLFMGEEYLATGTFANPPAALAAPTANGALVRAFYKDMIALRRDTASTTGGLTDANVDIIQRNDAAKVIAYRRYGASGQDVIVIVNLMNKAYTEYDIGVADPGPWQVRLTTDNTAYGADFTAGPTTPITARVGNKDGQAYTLPVVLGAYGAVVFSK